MSTSHYQGRIEHTHSHPQAQATAYAAFTRLSWGAIIAGAITAIAILTLLNLLGLSIGLATINPTEESNALHGLGTGSLIWFALANLIALFAGGWVAGRLAGFPKKSTSMTHGFLSWCVFAIFSFWVASSAVGATFNALGSTLSRAAGWAASGARSAGEAIGSMDNNADAANSNYQLTWQEVKREARAILEDTNTEALDPDNLEQTGERAIADGKTAARQALENPDRADQIVSNYINTLSDRASDIGNAVDKEAVAEVIAERRNMSTEQAMEIVDAWDQRLTTAYNSAQDNISEAAQTVRERSPEIAENAAEALSRAALYAFIALLLGAVAAALGGLSGRQLDIAVPGDQSLAATDVKP